ncbi:MAG: hypothetical protein WGN25_06015 [Candidatus Electrothrix sp. GW3-4]|uniref:hypothetical protein n=1 Tax=Candidatus Electrothrix sp. GW3-4 TaxID=3126740 RepID=UPI0030CE0C60
MQCSEKIQTASRSLYPILKRGQVGRIVSEIEGEQNKKKPAQPKEEEPAKKEEMKNTLFNAQSVPPVSEKRKTNIISKKTKGIPSLVSPKKIFTLFFNLFSFFYSTRQEKQNYIKKIRFIIKLKKI